MCVCGTKAKNVQKYCTKIEMHREKGKVSFGSETKSPLKGISVELW